MGKNQNSKKFSEKSPKGPAFYNDQLGENASEEYSGEIYENAAQAEEKPKEKA
ncbi:MAG: hypothetical protein WCQ54_11080 [Clostridiaceae bacterium]